MRYKYKYKYRYGNIFIFLFIVSITIFLFTAFRIVSEIHNNHPSIFLLTILTISMFSIFGLAVYLYDSPLDVSLRHYYHKKRSDLKQGFKDELKDIDDLFNPESFEFDADNLDLEN